MKDSPLGFGSFIPHPPAVPGVSNLWRWFAVSARCQHDPQELTDSESWQKKESKSHTKHFFSFASYLFHYLFNSASHAGILYEMKFIDTKYTMSEIVPCETWSLMCQKGLLVFFLSGKNNWILSVSLEVFQTNLGFVVEERGHRKQCLVLGRCGAWHWRLCLIFRRRTYFSFLSQAHSRPSRFFLCDLLDWRPYLGTGTLKALGKVGGIYYALFRCPG